MSSHCCSCRCRTLPRWSPAARRSCKQQALDSNSCRVGSRNYSKSGPAPPVSSLARRQSATRIGTLGAAGVPGRRMQHTQHCHCIDPLRVEHDFRIILYKGAYRGKIPNIIGRGCLCIFAPQCMAVKLTVRRRRHLGQLSRSPRLPRAWVRVLGPAWHHGAVPCCARIARHVDIVSVSACAVHLHCTGIAMAPALQWHFTLQCPLTDIDHLPDNHLRRCTATRARCLQVVLATKPAR